MWCSGCQSTEDQDFFQHPGPRTENHARVLLLSPVLESEERCPGVARRFVFDFPYGSTVPCEMIPEWGRGGVPFRFLELNPQFSAPKFCATSGGDARRPTLRPFCEETTTLEMPRFPCSDRLVQKLPEKSHHPTGGLRM